MWPLVRIDGDAAWTAPDPAAEWMWPRAAGRIGVPLRRLGDGGRYELLGLLNRGGQAFVWAARDHVSGALVAVKTARPESEDPAAATRLEREAGILRLLAGNFRIVSLLEWGPARLAEPGGPPVTDPYETQMPWLALPFLPHLRLPQALEQQGGTLGLAGTLGLGRDLAEGLAHIHQHGVVHRDLSPGNVLLTSSGAVLVDFGTAWADAAGIADIDDSVPVTGVTVLNGRGVTWGWAAPETTVAHPEDGDRPDRRPAGDVFGWGLHAFAAYTGRHPWSAGHLSLSAREQRAMYQLREPADLSDLASAPPELVTLVSAALSGSPGDRPTAAELLARLPDAADEPGPTRHRTRSTPDQKGVEPSEAVTRLRKPEPEHPGYSETTPGVPPLRTLSRPVLIGWSLGLVVLILLSIGLLVSLKWTRHEYSVGIQAGHVVIVDRPVRFPWGKETAAVTSTDIDTSLLPAGDHDLVDRGFRVSDLDAARRFVANLRSKADECSRSLVAPCPARRPQAPDVTATPRDYPHGNTVVVTWSSLDDRAGVVTTLSVTPSGNTTWSRDCPATVTSSGSCTFEGEFARTYEIQAMASSSQDPLPVSRTATLTTREKPSIRLSVGDRFRAHDGSLNCQFTVDVRGLATNTRYKVRLNSGGAVSTYQLFTSTDPSGDALGSPLGTPGDDDAGYWGTGNQTFVEVALLGLKSRVSPWTCT